MNSFPGPLPYTDTKPAGAADFYFAINATFRFVAKKLGRDGLHRYWRELGAQYFAPVTARWKAGGLPAVAEYWRAFFAAEPGGEVEVRELPEEVVLDVKVCPAIRHLRANGRELAPWFCEHCTVTGGSMAAPAGLGMRVEGGEGSCRQSFFRRESEPVEKEAPC